MILTVKRDIFGGEFTLSSWYVDGQFECFGCEDTDRHLENNPNGKIPGKTAIPRGAYDCIVSYSPRFKRDLPLLVAVPGFDGIRIHAGNTADNTEGCLLPGTARDTKAGRVIDSRTAFERLFEKIARAFNARQEIKVIVQ